MQNTNQHLENFFKHFRVEVLPIEHAPEFPQTIVISDSLKKYRVDFLDAFDSSAELSAQTDILERILSRIKAPTRIKFYESNGYVAQISQELAQSSSNSTNEQTSSSSQESSYEPKHKRRKHEILKSRAADLQLETPINDSFLPNYFNSQIAAAKWFNDFLWYYTDSFLDVDMKSIHFEVTKQCVASVYEHPDFFKVVVGLLSYYSFLKSNLEVNYNAFCTSTVLIAGTDVWVLHFMIEQDKANPQVFRKLLYMSEKYNVKIEVEAMQLEMCLKWAAETGLSSRHVINHSKSQVEALNSPIAKQIVVSIQDLSLREYFNTKAQLLCSIEKDEVLERLQTLFPDADFEEHLLTESSFDEICSDTRRLYFVLQNEIKCLDNDKVKNNRVCIAFGKWRVLIPKEKCQEWRIDVDAKDWNKILSCYSNNDRAFQAPKEVFDNRVFQNEDELFIKIESKSDPIVLTNLMKIDHRNIMKIVKIILVDDKFVASVNEKLYPLHTIFDKQNPKNRLNNSEIENIQFCFKIIRDVWNGLNCLLTKDIYYKDISFNNIMLSKDLSTAKLIDFEACCSTKVKWNEFSVYTSVYTPKEVYDQQSYIFSLVVILCELIFKVLSHHKRNYPLVSIDFKSKFNVKSSKNIPACGELKDFIVSQYAMYFPQHLYYIQYFVDNFIVEKKLRGSKRTFSLALEGWIKFLSKEAAW